MGCWMADGASGELMGLCGGSRASRLGVPAIFGDGLMVESKFVRMNDW